MTGHLKAGTWNRIRVYDIFQVGRFDGPEARGLQLLPKAYSDREKGWNSTASIRFHKMTIYDIQLACFQRVRHMNLGFACPARIIVLADR